MPQTPAVLRASVRTLRPLVAALAAAGVDTAAMLDHAGIDPAVMSDTDARVPASIVHALWDGAATLSGDADFGLGLSRHIQPGSYDVLDFLCRNAATVGAGLEQYCRYTQLLHDGIVATVAVNDEILRLRHVLSDGTIVPRQYGEFIIASILTIARQAAGLRIVPLRVRFLHPEPHDIGAHRALFGCPIEFDADSNGFDLTRADAERPLQQAQPGLFRVLEEHADHLLAEAPRPASLVAQVRAAIMAELRNGTVSARSVAQAIGLSERTLRRRLDTESTSYQRILSELRMELADRYMQEAGLSLDEIALLLGFSDRTSFYRAFRGWTGRSPTEYRAAHPAADRG